MAGVSAFCVGDNKIGGIGVDRQLHVAGKVSDLRIGVMGKEVHHPGGFLHGVLGGRGLLSADFVEGDKDRIL